MKEMFSISSGVDVAKAKPTTISMKESKSADTTSSKDFLSIMFAQIKESLASDQTEELNIKPIISEEEIIKIDSSDSKTTKSLDEHLLDDLLKVVNLLKNSDEKKVTFPSFSNKIEKIINNEVALKELKDVKNITDLLNISKKYNLGLEKISVQKLDLESIKKEFPKLDQKFFEIPKESVQKTDKVQVDVKKETEIKPTVLSINNIKKPVQEAKTEPTLFEKMMSSPKETDKKEALIVNKNDVKKEALIVNKNDVKKEALIVNKDDVKKEALIVNKNDVKKGIKVIQEETPKIIAKENQKELKTKIAKDDLHVKVNNEVKTPETTRVVEPKVQTNIPQKGIIENILQAMKTEKQTITPNPSATTPISNSSEEIQSTESSETKTESNLNRHELKPQIKTDTIASKQLSPTKDTFNNFAAEFKEKLESYKPPFMRVQMALTPKGLGEVDVTIVNRGNNLHVNITSNTNTMSIFTQNQAEFKNALVNMGFTNLEMNFSDQRESKEQHNNNKSSKEFNENYEDENLEEETTSLELVVPQYV